MKLISFIKKKLTADIISNEEIKIIEYLKKELLFELNKPEIYMGIIKKNIRKWVGLKVKTNKDKIKRNNNLLNE